jgi:hypothetical protein
MAFPSGFELTPKPSRTIFTTGPSTPGKRLDFVIIVFKSVEKIHFNAHLFGQMPFADFQLICTKYAKNRHLK